MGSHLVPLCSKGLELVFGRFDARRRVFFVGHAPRLCGASSSGSGRNSAPCAPRRAALVSWEKTVDCLRKSLESVHRVSRSDQDVLDTAVLKFTLHTQPELRSLRLTDPKSKQVFVTFEVDRNRNVDGARLYVTALADI